MDLKKKTPDWAVALEKAKSEAANVTSIFEYKSGRQKGVFKFKYTFGDKQLRHQLDRLKAKYGYEGPARYITKALDDIVSDLRVSLAKSFADAVEQSVNSGGHLYLVKRGTGGNMAMTFSVSRGAGMAGGRRVRKSKQTLIQPQRMFASKGYEGFELTFGGKPDGDPGPPEGKYKKPFEGVSSVINRRLPDTRDAKKDSGQSYKSNALEYGDPKYQRELADPFEGELDGETHYYGSHSFQGSIQKNMKAVNKLYSDLIYEIFNTRAVLVYNGRKMSISRFIKEATKTELENAIGKIIAENKKQFKNEHAKKRKKPFMVKKNFTKSKQKQASDMIRDVFGTNSDYYRYLDERAVNAFIRYASKRRKSFVSLDSKSIKEALEETKTKMVKIKTVKPW